MACVDRDIEVVGDTRLDLGSGNERGRQTGSPQFCGEWTTDFDLVSAIGAEAHHTCGAEHLSGLGHEDFVLDRDLHIAVEGAIVLRICEHYISCKDAVVTDLTCAHNDAMTALPAETQRNVRERPAANL
jgi:hypothetical protein